MAIHILEKRCPFYTVFDKKFVLYLADDFGYGVQFMTVAIIG